MDNQFAIENSGFIESPEDKRDFLLGQVQAPVTIPPVFKPDYSFLPIYFQAKQPACTGHATAFLVNFNEWIENGDSGKQVFSPRMLYALSKKDDGIPDNPGTYYRQALKELHDHGICLDSLFPNDTSLPSWEYNDTKKISDEAFSDAEPRKISSYVKVNDLSWNGLKQAIYQNKVVLLGLKVGASFWTDVAGNITWEASKILPLRPPTPMVSGHAVVLYGYDENYLYFRNSFGPTWGLGGVGWFGKDYLPFVVEAWTEVDLPDALIIELKKKQISLIDKLKQYVSILLNKISFGR